MLEAGEFEEESFLEGGRGGGGGREGGIHAVRTLVVYLVSLQVAQSLSYSLLHGNHLTAQSAVILEERYREGRMYRYMCK